ncbi:hypothetical protein HUN58_14465 [Curtobacterium sp. Csp1]|uniref:hypothetical protein n=1 Tax=unclassified Curtobacterium TaxID=257496 RepID=UPI0015979938|nr:MULTISPECIES: hypothetical protein [unclassified Curtobacterium]QKS13914.1 hypothetical protein HUN60_12900 [Curtobacterium sp. csp3]QKS20957.1 hypothetical protein HUN58_14465 [Curtobacterium sp. Csp1]
MPEIGLSILPKDLRKRDLITLPDLGDVLVLDLSDAGDAVWATVWDGVHDVTTIRLHKLIPVGWRSGTEARDFRVVQVLRRGVPWFVVSIAVALVAGLAHAPMWGGQVVLIVALWFFGGLRMATTPRVLR